jgi:hypothetical protein
LSGTFASKEKTLHANLGDHRDVRWSWSMTRSWSGISAPAGTSPA